MNIILNLKYPYLKYMKETYLSRGVNLNKNAKQYQEFDISELQVTLSLSYTHVHCIQMKVISITEHDS